MKPQMTCILNRIWWESSLVVCAVSLIGVLRCVRFGRRHFFKVISGEAVFCVSSRTIASSKANESVVWKTKNVQHFANRQYNPNAYFFCVSTTLMRTFFVSAEP